MYLCVDKKIFWGRVLKNIEVFWGEGGLRYILGFLFMYVY